MTCPESTSMKKCCYEPLVSYLYPKYAWMMFHRSIGYFCNSIISVGIPVKSIATTSG